MANFRNKVLGLAGVGLVFAGMSYGQMVTCGAIGASAANGTSPNANTIRSEGQTELVGNLQFQCTNPTGGAVAINLQVFVLPSPLTITSKALDTATPPNTEAQAIIVAGAGAQPAAGVYGTPGTIGSGGASLNFALSLPANGGMAQTITITNVRVNASALAAASVTPVYEQAYIAGGATVTSFTSTQTQVALAEPGLAAITISANQAAPLKAVPNVAVCVGLPAVAAPANNLTSATFYVNFQEGFGNAFKNANNATDGGAGTTSSTSATTNNTETNLYIKLAGESAGAGYAASFITGGNLATQNTRIQVVFTNVPAGVSLYVPVLLTSSAVYGGGNTVETFALTASATAGYGALTPISNSTDNPTNNDYLLPAGSGGTVVAVYDYQTPAANVANAAAAATVAGIFQVPVVERFAANTVTAGLPAIGVQLSFAPVNAQTTNLPSFAITSSSPQLTANGFSACSTTLIFPYVTQGSGFDVGIAISNTSLDNLGTGGKSSAATSTGTCSLNFYGSGGSITPSATGTVFPGPTGSTGNIFAGGTSSATLLSILNPGFSGYIVANCGFLYAHGYAYIFTNYGTANATVASYLPLVVNSNTASRAATPETIAH